MLGGQQADRRTEGRAAQLTRQARGGVQDGAYRAARACRSELSGAERSKNEWTREDERRHLHVEWIEHHDTLDPVRHSKRVTARLTHRPVGGESVVPMVVEDESLQRWFTADDIARLVAQSGCFRVVASFGARDESVALDVPSAWRMVLVLQRISASPGLA